MNSPFPGLDPYLEQFWGDVHTTLMVYARNQLNAQLPNDLQALVEESLSVAINDETSRTIYPDVRVVESEEYSAGESVPAAVAVAEPVVVVVESEPLTLRHIEIVDISRNGRVVTAIELLGPANKVRASGRDAYREKQRFYLESGVNLVEIDLVRAGAFVLAVPKSRVPPEFRGSPLICIRRAHHPGHYELYDAPLRMRLPNIPIPLRPSDRDVVLELQPLFDACYRDGRHDRINYRRDASPPLSGDDARWADALLSESGRR